MPGGGARGRRGGRAYLARRDRADRPPRGAPRSLAAARDVHGEASRDRRCKRGAVVINVYQHASPLCFRHWPEGRRALGLVLSIVSIASKVTSRTAFSPRVASAERIHWARVRAVADLGGQLGVDPANIPASGFELRANLCWPRLRHRVPQSAFSAGVANRMSMFESRKKPCKRSRAFAAGRSRRVERL